MARIRQFDWSPNWYIIWAERQPDGRWRSRQLSTGARVEADAKRALAEFEALDGTKHARAQAMTMAGWFQEWSRQHKARAKLARDAAGRLRDVSGRL